MPVRAWRFKSSHPHSAGAADNGRPSASQSPVARALPSSPPSPAVALGGQLAATPRAVASGPTTQVVVARLPAARARHRRERGQAGRRRAAAVRVGAPRLGPRGLDPLALPGRRERRLGRAAALVTSRASAPCRGCEADLRARRRIACSQGPDAATIRARELPGADPRQRRRRHQDRDHRRRRRPDASVLRPDRLRDAGRASRRARRRTRRRR